MSEPLRLTPGVYEHYKGKRYLAIGVAHHSETGELLAVYRPLYGDYHLYARPLRLFNATVEVDGRAVPRFRLVQELVGI